MKKNIISMAAAMAVLSACGPGVPQLGKSSLDEVIGAMTLEEKAHLVVGTGMAGFSGDSAVIGATRKLVPGAAGTTYPLDREFTAMLLDFDGPCANSMDGVSDRDYLIETLNSCAVTMMHLSRLSEELIIWNTNEYRFIELDDTYATGSSIMPQKKNPDIAELIRGKTGRVYGALMQLLTTMKGLPLAYNKDMQEDKELSFDAIDTTKGCLVLMNGMLGAVTFHAERMAQSATGGFTNATDAADYLVRKGVPFRDAHGIIGQLVIRAIELGISLDEMPLSEYRKVSDVFDEDLYEAISLKTCVEKRGTLGAPGAMEEELASSRAYLEEIGAFDEEDVSDGTEHWFEH